MATQPTLSPGSTSSKSEFSSEDSDSDDATRLFTKALTFEGGFRRAVDRFPPVSAGLGCVGSATAMTAAARDIIKSGAERH